jgi:5-(carboxyamino)imidazole ribonucleotide synthase
VKLHLYGKAEPKPARKMGHLTAADLDNERSVDRALRAFDRLR